MKRFNFLLCVLIILLSVSLFINLKLSDITFSLWNINLNDTNFDTLYPYIISDNSESKEKVIYLMNKLPGWLIKRFEKDGWIIKITDEDFNSTYFDEYHDLSGLTVRDEKIIYLKPNAIDYAFYHEMGHFIDIYKNYSQTEEFIDIFFSESLMAKFTNEKLARYSIGTPAEYFATSFQTIIEDETVSQQSQYKTYNYIIKVLEEMENEE